MDFCPHKKELSCSGSFVLIGSTVPCISLSLTAPPATSPCFLVFPSPPLSSPLDQHMLTLRGSAQRQLFGKLPLSHIILHEEPLLCANVNLKNHKKKPPFCLEHLPWALHDWKRYFHCLLITCWIYFHSILSWLIQRNSTNCIKIETLQTSITQRQVPLQNMLTF